MATLAVVVAILVVGTALGLVRLIRTNGRRITALEHELDDVYQAQRILERARTRKDRKHLHLLGLVPLAWLLRSSHARLAAATGISAAIVGVGFTAPDNPGDPPLQHVPPAAAETLENTPAPVDTPAYSYATPPTPTVPTTSTTVAVEAVVPPSASTVVEAGSAPTEPPPSTVPAPSTTTMLPVEVEVEVPRVCITPAGTILDACAAS